MNKVRCSGFLRINIVSGGDGGDDGGCCFALNIQTPFLFAVPITNDTQLYDIEDDTKVKPKTKNTCLHLLFGHQCYRSAYLSFPSISTGSYLYRHKHKHTRTRYHGAQSPWCTSNSYDATNFIIIYVCESSAKYISDAREWNEWEIYFSIIDIAPHFIASKINIIISPFASLLFI